MGSAIGTLTRTPITKSIAPTGSLTLKIQGPTEEGFGPFPPGCPTPSSSGTGDLAKATGSGAITVKFGKRGTFSFVFTPAAA
jgi:hypothetical protein